MGILSPLRTSFNKEQLPLIHKNIIITIIITNVSNFDSIYKQRKNLRILRIYE